MTAAAAAAAAAGADPVFGKVRDSSRGLRDRSPPVGSKVQPTL